MKEPKQPKPYKVRKKRRPLFRFLCSVARIFKKNAKTVNLSGGELPQKAIYLMSHCGAAGPFEFEMSFPVKATPWSAHEMCGGFGERWNYLYHVFYRQKLHWGKVRSFIMATLFGIVAGFIYGSIGVIGTYTDVRVLSSIRNSVAVLNEGMSIVIFPEDSDEGYFAKPSSFHQGFVILSEIYFKRTETDLPVYNVFYSKKKKVFVVDKPLYINKMLEEGRTKDEVADIFLRNCHVLCDYAGHNIDKHGNVL